MDHEILIMKHGIIGVSGQEIRLFKSYLTNRMQTVFTNSKYSSLLPNPIGVPQGSNLGPLLFIIFMNDISDLSLHGTMQLFADDIVIKFQSDSLLKLHQQMQDDMDKLEKWFNFNKLVLNVSKSKVMYFNNHRYTSLPVVKYQNDTLEIVKTYKYLGLFIRWDLKWDAHIDHLKSKIAPYIFALYKLRHTLPSSALKIIYYAYIHSHIIYLNPIWSGASQQKLNELYIYQKRAIKNIMHVDRMFPTYKLFLKDFRSLHYIILEQLILLTHKLIHNHTKNNCNFTLRSSIHNYETRVNNLYELEFFNTNMRSHNIINKGLTEFNKLPIVMRTQFNTIMFKKELKLYLDTKFTINNENDDHFDYAASTL